jgi:hypothetical protein
MFCDPGDTTLVACYEFEDSLADGSPHHLDPNIMMNVGYGPGKVGRALVVGPNTEVDVPESSLFNTTLLTIEAWINPMRLPTDQRAGILDCEGRYGFFVHGDGKLYCTAGNIGAAGPIMTQRWTHVACTNDGTAIRIYIDGTLASTTTSQSPPPLGAQTGITLGGNNPPGGGEPLNGSLDEVRLFRSARSASQICADALRSPCP